MDDAPKVTFWTELWEGVKRIAVKALGLLSSRKFWAATIAFLVSMEVPDKQIQLISQISTLLVFILATAYEDAHSQ